MPKIQVDAKFQKGDEVIARLINEETKLPHPVYTEVKILGFDHIKYVFQNEPQIYYLAQTFGNNYVLHESQLISKEDFVELFKKNNS